MYVLGKDGRLLKMELFDYKLVLDLRVLFFFAYKGPALLRMWALKQIVLYI